MKLTFDNNYKITVRRAGESIGVITKMFNMGKGGIGWQFIPEANASRLSFDEISDIYHKMDELHRQGMEGVPGNVTIDKSSAADLLNS